MEGCGVGRFVRTKPITRGTEVVGKDVLGALVGLEELGRHDGIEVGVKEGEILGVDDGWEVGWLVGFDNG